MALPTAPLGQLPSMNMPYAIPTYDKGPSIWEKALGAFLVNAVADTGSQLAKNVLTRDEASTFGEKNATGFSRLMGPNVSPQEAAQRRQQSFTAEENAKGRTFDADQLEQRLMAAAGENDAQAANARLLAGDQTQARLDEQYLQDQNAGLRQDRGVKADIELENTRNTNLGKRQGEASTADQALARLRAELEGKDPGRLAQARRDNLAADLDQSKIDMNKYFFGGGAGTPSQPGDGVRAAPPQGAQPAVDPSIAAFRNQRSSNPTVGNVSKPSVMDYLRANQNVPGSGVSTNTTEAPNPQFSGRVEMTPTPWLNEARGYSPESEARAREEFLSYAPTGVAAREQTRVAEGQHLAALARQYPTNQYADPNRLPPPGSTSAPYDFPARPADSAASLEEFMANMPGANDAEMARRAELSAQYPTNPSIDPTTLPLANPDISNFVMEIQKLFGTRNNRRTPRN